MAFMSLKGRISSPLEAGTSILDDHNLPGHLHSALEYTSKRLARKAVHLTLVVVRRDYQIPSSALSTPASSSLSSPPATISPPISAANTPARPAFNLATIKNIVRPGVFSPSLGHVGGHGGSSTSKDRRTPAALDLDRNGMASPAFSVSSVSSASTSASTASSTADSTFSCCGHRFRSPLSPASPPSMPMTPATPFTMGSSATTTDVSSAASGAPCSRDPHQFGIRLVHVAPLALWEEKLLKQTIERAEKKFRVGTNWLSNALPPSAYGLNAELVRRSLSQNEVLFSSEGLTLLSLDHLYTFKTALASYVRTQAPRRLEDALDELRRLFLSQGRRKLRKSALITTYPWLGRVSDSALADVSRMYRRAYGGPAGESGIEDDVGPACPSSSGAQSPVSPVPDKISRASSAHSWLLPHRPAPKTTISYDGLDKALPALPSATEQDRDEKTGRSASEYGVPAPDKGFCLDFDLDCDLGIEEYYRGQARGARATEEEADRARREEQAALEEMMRTTPKISAPPPPKIPALKLQTTFDDKKPGALRPGTSRPAEGEGITGAEGGTASVEGFLEGVQRPRPFRPPQQEQGEKEIEEKEEDEGELTARPKSGQPNTLAASLPSGLCSWNRLTISEILLDTESRTSRQGPMTPNEYDDISPVTRGEWGFLMVGDAWKAKTVAVEMC